MPEDTSAKNDRDEYSNKNVNAVRGSIGYMPINEYGLIGNMRTAALVASDGSIDHMCWPDFSSPTVFCRLLDQHKGGHFQIVPLCDSTSKQTYIHSSNCLQTRWLSEDQVTNVTDFFPLYRHRDHGSVFKAWLVRRLECVRGSTVFRVECFPAFDYAQRKHTATIVDNGQNKPGSVVFESEGQDGLKMELLCVTENEDSDPSPTIEYELVHREGHRGPGVLGTVKMSEMQYVSFVFREVPKADSEEAMQVVDAKSISKALSATISYWIQWLDQSRYHGRWREFVERSVLLLKLLTYEPTGALIAAPTFSLPEEFGGKRNWDYRYSWIRDAAFTIYAFIRLGFVQEADAFMGFIEKRLEERGADGSIRIMYSINGEHDLEEIELSHLEGYRGSAPVRIGNGASNHLQLDIYGELMDAIYLYNKYGRPISWNMWIHVRSLCDYVCDHWKEPDMSIWEVRSKKENFTYSKVMMWVALDRGLRLAEKRCLPCPNGPRWRRECDSIYESVMEHGYNKELGVGKTAILSFINLQAFIQSYEAKNVLDSAVLIMPLVFFISPCDPRFTNTIKKILRPPDKGGLVSNSLVFRCKYSSAVAKAIN